MISIVDKTLLQESKEYKYFILNVYNKLNYKSVKINLYLIFLTIHNDEYFTNAIVRIFAYNYYNNNKIILLTYYYHKGYFIVFTSNPGVIQSNKITGFLC